MRTETVTERRFVKMRPVPVGDVPPLSRGDLPPGPPLPGLLQSIGLLRFRHHFIPFLQRRYGDIFSVKIMPEGRHLVVFNRPEHVKEIFSGDPEVFHAGKGNAILGPVMGEHSLLLVDSAQHKRARKLLMPAFNGHALRGYEDLVTGLAKTEVGRWREGEAFRSLERMNALTLEVILQVVFGVTDESRLAELRPLVNKTVNIPPLVFLGWGFPKLQKYGPWRRTIENQVELDRVMFRVIAERREATDLAERTDVLSRLLEVRDEAGSGLTDEELRDQLVTLLLAGHETTATALAWTLHELGKDPAQEAKARDAASAGELGVPRGGAQGVHAAAPGDPDGGPPPDGAGHGRRRRPAAGRQRGRVDHPGPRVGGQPSRARPVPAGALPRGRGRDQHVDPLRWRRTTVHRRWLLADGGGGRSPRGAHDVRRGAASGHDRGCQGPQHHQRPAPRCPDRRSTTAA